MKLTQTMRAEAYDDGVEALMANPKKKRALIYPNGFVPNSYYYPAPAERVCVEVITQLGHKPLCRCSIQTYDRKRSYGKGSYITLWNN